MPHCQLPRSDHQQIPFNAHYHVITSSNVRYRGLHIRCHKKKFWIRRNSQSNQYFHLHYILIGPFSRDTIDFL